MTSCTDSTRKTALCHHMNTTLKQSNMTQYKEWYLVHDLAAAINKGDKIACLRVNGGKESSNFTGFDIQVKVPVAGTCAYDAAKYLLNDVRSSFNTTTIEYSSSW